MNDIDYIVDKYFYTSSKGRIYAETIRDIEKNIIIVSGIDKELIGQVSAKIRKVRKPEPYKGKGIRYLGEQVRRKVGKKAAGTES